VNRILKNVKMIEPTDKIGNITLYNADCMEVMKQFKDKEFDLAIVDPPYGIGMDGGTIKKLKNRPNWKGCKYDKKDWDNSIPKKEYFDELFRVSKNQIIWGGNYFTEYLKPTKAWIIWDKGQYGLTMSDCEMAWSSFNTVTRIKKINRVELLKQNTIHPTEKPFILYRWLLQNYAKPNDKIIDTHSGSGSLACACHLEKFDFLAIEKDEDYFKSSVERLETLRSQGRLF